MQENRTRYPSYDVLKEKDQWDEHTREIVIKRLGPFPKNKFLKEHEAKAGHKERGRSAGH
jgi:hypothetical protein